MRFIGSVICVIINYFESIKNAYIPILHELWVEPIM